MLLWVDILKSKISLQIQDMLVFLDSDCFSSDQEILISSKDFADVKVGDVLELYHPDDEWK